MKFRVVYLSRKKNNGELQEMKSGDGKLYKDTIHANCIIYRPVIVDGKLSTCEVEHIRGILKDIF